jgi:hypothetical protein
LNTSGVSLWRILHFFPDVLWLWCVFISGFFLRLNKFYLALPAVVVFNRLVHATLVRLFCVTGFSGVLGWGYGEFCAAILGIRADLIPFQT